MLALQENRKLFDAYLAVYVLLIFRRDDLMSYIYLYLLRHYMVEAIFFNVESTVCTSYDSTSVYVLERMVTAITTTKKTYVDEITSTTGKHKLLVLNSP